MKGQDKKVVIDADIHSGSAHQSSEVGTQFSCVLGIVKQCDPPKCFSFQERAMYVKNVDGAITFLLVKFLFEMSDMIK